MPRLVNLRQVEAFKAFVEAETVGGAAKLLGVTQPAISKILAHFQSDCGLRLFERVRGRLTLTPEAVRLYGQIDAIFAGLNQVQSTIEMIRREEQKHLEVGMLPALAGPFFRKAVLRFRQAHPEVHLSILSLATKLIGDGVATRRLDVGIVQGNLSNPAIAIEPLMTSSLVCIMPLRHKLAARRVVHLEELTGFPFIGFMPTTETARSVDARCRSAGITLDITITASTAQMVSGLVAEGLGLSLVHPLTLDLTRQELIVRRLKPPITTEFAVCSLKGAPNARLVQAFTRIVRDTEKELANTRLGQISRGSP